MNSRATSLRGGAATYILTNIFELRCYILATRLDNTMRLDRLNNDLSDIPGSIVGPAPGLPAAGQLGWRTCNSEIRG
eukprot:7884823-Lingulodinium_polyedra.AAC.1